MIKFTVGQEDFRIIDIEPDKGTEVAAGAEENVVELPAKPKLKRKSDLENSLLEAIEEHGSDKQ